MKYNPHAEITYMHHTAGYLLTPECWIITSRGYGGIVAIVATSTTNHATKITTTLVLGEHELPLDPIVRPGGMRTALRWVCQELNNGHFWLGTRLALEREARLLGYDEPKILACEHAKDYQYCLALLTNLPGLVENWPER